MNTPMLFLCDECSTLAIVTMQGNTITINKCLCSTKGIEWNKNRLPTTAKVYAGCSTLW